MSMSFGQFDFDNALQNVSQAYRRASQVATEAASQASQAASQAASDFALWSAGQEPEEESESELDEDLPEVAAVRDLLRPVASVLLARPEHADLFSYVLTSKDEVGSCAGEMLFGRPEDGATMTRFWLRRKPSHGLQVVAGGLDQRPNEEELREEEHEQQISAHSGDAWLRILNLNDEPSILDFKVDAAHGCAPQALPEAMALFAVAPYALEVLLLAAFDQPKSAPRRRSRPSTAAYLTSAPAKKTCSSSRRVRHAATQLVPRIMAVLRRIVALKSMELGVNALADLDGSVNVLRVDAKVPLDFQALDKHYKRVGKLLKHYDLVSVKAYDHKTDACLFTFCIQDGWIHVCFHLMEGQLAWPSEGTRAAMPLTFGDGIKLDLEIQLSLLLMGLTLPAVALPKLFLEVVITAGNVQVVCQEAGEEESSESHHHAETDWSAQVMSSISSAAWAAAESAANLAYDFQLLRRLLKEKFFFNLSFEKGSENASGESVAKMRTAMELAIPKSAAAEVVTQCLKHFLTEQLKKMDLLTLFRDLLEAVGQDLSRLALSEDALRAADNKSAQTKQFL
ncbi:unnamed protein product [Cladocopium goreaui]|uniref:Chaperone protein DnaJ n=1 Tax=Cladocopium goreaui TaxID=2562237 RepID=A0A9P1G9E0_9DINO|nr:unnamed protein product [Cladocopium goreaui]